MAQGDIRFFAGALLELGKGTHNLAIGPFTIDFGGAGTDVLTITPQA